MDNELRHKITELIKREVLPAVGCTEPAAVALAVAKASEILETRPERVEVRLSGNILKNAMGVGIPGTGMIGLPVAIALGAVIGDASNGLELLKEVDSNILAEAKKFIQDDRIAIYHEHETHSNLYIDAIVEGKNDSARAVIAYNHTNFIKIERSGETLLDNLSQSADRDDSEANDECRLNLKTVWEYATESDLSEIEFINDARVLNTKAARLALDSNGLGHKVGKTILSNSHYIGHSPLLKMLALTAGACDARMAGEPVAVMSNSGSGNQGIAITMPVVAYAEEIKATSEKTTRALALAHLTSIYIKQSLGRLSALCGCVVASTGASLALVYLMDGDYNQGVSAVKNMIATLTGMICDGAKPACSLKIASGVSTAYISALMAMNGECVTSTEGIIEDNVDETIKNFCDIGRDAMLETDKMVLRIMSGSNK